MANQIAQVRKARKMSQQKLAELVGAHWITISKLERGIMQLTEVWMEKLAAALKVDPTDLLISGNPLEEIAFLGFIDPGGFVDVDDLEPKHMTTPRIRKNDPFSYWLMVSEHAFYPFCNHGDIIKFVEVDPGEAEHYVGKICLAKYKDRLEDKKSDLYGVVGFLELGSVYGKFDIRPAVGKPIKGLTLHELAVAEEVRFMLPWDDPDHE